ncbi:hypothetical protein ACFP81_08615 [Deinococcus lacus]|uniref:Uncharacterized protein n=1 Tax=Deinococcus lacus TaxID=392561 RepID=A0ABW1YGS3_9DEIO
MGKSRKIFVEGRDLYYAVRELEGDTGALFTAQMDGKPQHRLSIRYPYFGDKYTGNALLQGLMLMPEQPERSRINLHALGLAAQLIFYALHHGWLPECGRMHLEDGGEVLGALGYRMPT